MSHSQSLDTAFLPDPGGSGEAASAPTPKPGSRLVRQGTFDQMVDRLDKPLQVLQQAYRDGRRPFLALSSLKDDIEPLRTIAQRWRTAFDNVVIFGTGGSSLGGQTLYQLADLGFGLSMRERSLGAPRLHFLDNIDPATFEAMLDNLDLKSTGFIAISKSGKTAETLMQLLLVVQALRERGDDSRVAKQILLVTEPGLSPMRRLAIEWDLQVVDHDPGVGGRFAVLSVVGVLPMMIAGLDPIALRSGAEKVLQDTLGARRARDSKPALGAALNVAYMEAGCSSAVLLPYCDRLGRFGQWWRQLWAESLGKLGRGSTPIPAVGAVDQHSQLQLWLDGPKDKLFTVITLATAGQGPTVRPGLTDSPELDWIIDRSLGDLLHVEGLATVRTLAANGLPVRHIRLARLAEADLGGLLMHFMLETMLAADLLGVNPFDQPAVEQGKALARQLMAEL